MTQQIKRQQSHFAVRKIIDADGDFVCGMCRTHYENLEQAQRCLTVCATEQLTGLSVERIRYHGQPRFRCGLCRRMYLEIKKAEYCIVACRQKLVDESALDNVEGLDKKIKQGKRKTYVAQPKAQKVKLIPPYRLRKMISDSDIDNEINASTGGDGAKGAGELGPDGQPLAKKEPVKRCKADLKDKFIRQGAQYQCAYCMQMYYTKVEVKACFEAHPDEEMVPG